MRNREREKALKKIFKDYGLKNKIVAKGVEMNQNSLNVYMSTVLPRRYEDRIIKFLEEFAKNLLRDIKKL